VNIDREEVRRIAELARLALEPAELETYREQLGSILEYVALLDEVDLDSSPVRESTAAEPTVQRPDTRLPALSQAEALKNAPVRAEGHFGVPRVLK
jgi:aspartyl-tRNA(Asn)/glutamyl-tRNA(Gln) amidotransferase subunit C